MNATRWVTLTEFVKFLGHQGEAVVEDTPKVRQFGGRRGATTWQGWFVTYIDRDPDAIKRKEEDAAMEKRALDEEDHARA